MARRGGPRYFRSDGARKVCSNVGGLSEPVRCRIPRARPRSRTMLWSARLLRLLCDEWGGRRIRFDCQRSSRSSAAELQSCVEGRPEKRLCHSHRDISRSMASRIIWSRVQPLGNVFDSDVRYATTIVYGLRAGNMLFVAASYHLAYLKLLGWMLFTLSPPPSMRAAHFRG